MRHILSYFFCSTPRLEGTVITLTVVFLDFSKLIGTSLQILTSKRYNKYPCHPAPLLLVSDPSFVTCLFALLHYIIQY